MRVAITFDNGQVFQHFGHAEHFSIYTIEENNIVSSEIMDTNGQGHSALAAFLKENKVDVLICGGIGGGAQVALNEAGIKIYGGVKGTVEKSIKAFLNGTLIFDPHVHCDHHDHGEHSCGGDHCHD